MNDLQIKALIAGVFFGTWPLLMNRSGLTGTLPGFAFACIATGFMIPFAFGELWSIPPNVKWAMVVTAGLFGAIGMVCFSSMMAKATPQSIGTLFVMMNIVQIAIPAVYQVMMNGGLSLTKGIGFALAAAAAFLLNKG